MQAQKLTESSCEQKKFELELALLRKLRSDFIALQNKLLQDAIFSQEHDQYIRSKPASFHKISPVFIESIIDPLQVLCQRYTFIKDKLIPLIGADRINEIESVVMTTAKKNEDKFNKLVYFPAYQKVHEASVNSHEHKQLEKIRQTKLEMQSIENNYTKRGVDYNTSYFITGVMSVCVIGIPFLIATAVAHLIDTLITSIQLAVLNNKISSVQDEIRTDFDPNAIAINKKILTNPTSLMMQGFFSVSKLRYQKCMREVEEYIPKVTCT